MRSTRLGVVLLLCGGLAWPWPCFEQEFFSPRRAPPSSTFNHDHIIGTSLDLWITTTDEAAAESAEQAILDEIERLRRIFSLYDPDSELCRLNRTREPMAVSKRDDRGIAALTRSGKNDRAALSTGNSANSCASGGMPRNRSARTDAAILEPNRAATARAGLAD